jgi:hypothetical protein
MQDSALSQPPPAGQTKTSRQMGWFVFCLVCVLWVMAISGQSLWIDEACAAAWWGHLPTLPAWWLTLVQDHSSEAQTPLYLLYIWGFAKVFGLAEWTLRAANLPWLILGFWAWMRTCGERENFKWGLAAVAATSPFLWYYLNEARPYIMQAGCILLIAAAARQLCTAPARFWLAAFCFGTVGLYGSNMLGAFWAGAAVATTLCVLGWDRIKPLARAHYMMGLATLLLLAGIGAYYLWTVKNGDRATAVGTTNAKNIGFIFYELFGFEGLGPGRLEIRGGGLESFFPYVWGLAAYALILIPVALAGARGIIQRVPIRTVLYSILFFGGVFVFLSLVGVVMHFRLLGRHCTPLLVLVVCLLGMGVARLWSSRHWWARGWVVLFVGLSLASSLSLRYAPRHARDNYRSAAAIAKQALQDGKTVWWNANERGAAYYHLPLATNGVATAGQALLLVNPSREMLLPAARPDMIIASRPDVYDGSGALAELVSQAGYQPVTNLMAFTVWARSAK